ncbi:Protein yipf4 [Conglomerata obtusa]
MSEYKEVYIDRIDLKAALTGSTYTDPPLLTELGIDFSLIKKESLLVFKPRAIEQCDITGPIIITFLYALSLLCNGKIHFGYVYFLTLSSNLLIYFLLNAIKSTQKCVDLARCFSVLGYSFLPVVVFAFLHAFCGYLKYVGFVCAGWSCYVASIVFCRYLEMEEMFFLIGYPILLMYMCYVFLIIF